MNTTVRNTEPKSLWNHFADLNAVPRPSKKEERVIQFMKDFGAKLGLETIEDEVGNVFDAESDDEQEQDYDNLAVDDGDD